MKLWKLIARLFGRARVRVSELKQLEELAEIPRVSEVEPGKRYLMITGVPFSAQLVVRIQDSFREMGLDVLFVPGIPDLRVYEVEKKKRAAA